MTERELMKRVNRGVMAGTLSAWGIMLLVMHFNGVVQLSGTKIAFALTACIVGALIYFGATDGYTGDE